MKNLQSKYNRLKVIKNTLNSILIKGRKRWYVKVKCDCGIIKVVNAQDLVGNKVKSCGCLWKETNIEKLKILNKTLKETGKYPSISHGETKTRLYRIYRGMWQRCLYKKSKKYSRYGGRGIKLEWKCYEDFKKDMYKSYEKSIKKNGEKNTTIDRINNDGNYCKKNCRWATNKEQSINKTGLTFITHQGKTLHIAEWSRLLGIKRTTICSRINIYKLTNPAEILSITRLPRGKNKKIKYEPRTISKAF